MNEGNSNTGKKQRPDLHECENGMNRGTLQTWGDKLDWPPWETFNWIPTSQHTQPSDTDELKQV